MGFKLNNKANQSGTSLQGYIAFHYCDLLAAFGESDSCDGYKVSTEWIFENDKGEVFTLYDYKETSDYDNSLPSVEAFRNQPNAYEWHIGAINDGPGIEAFKVWLNKTVVRTSGPQSTETSEARDAKLKEIVFGLERHGRLNNEDIPAVIEALKNSIGGI